MGKHHIIQASKAVFYPSLTDFRPSMTYLQRTIEPTFRRALASFPAVVINGPRQAGKTTLLRHLLGATHKYVSLEIPAVRAAATNDPAGFMQQHPPPVIFDEVHNAPVLLHYVKEHIDANRDATGQFVLTGSQNLLMLEKVTETLAGRAAILTLLPLSVREILHQPDRPFVWESQPTRLNPEPTRNPTHAGFQVPETRSMLLKGGYPELWAHANREIQLWYESYILTYIERDVRAMRAIGDLSRFREFMQMLALRHGQLLNMSELGRDLGLTGPTCKAWLSILEAGHQVMLLRPWHGNPSKRMVKSPKVYFTDSGVVCALCGLDTASQLMRGPMAGAVFEGAVVMEVAKTLHARGRQPRMWFWRSSHGEEVDLLVEGNWQDGEGHDIHGLVPIEAKATSTIRPEHFRGIRAFRLSRGASDGESGEPDTPPASTPINPTHTGFVACLANPDAIPKGVSLQAL